MRRVRRKGGNKEKVFGCDLLEHLNASSHEVPQVLKCCSEFVETHGIVDGIYRLSGVSSNIQKLRGEFESDGTPDLNKEVYLQDIHCVSSLCKAYFRELPNPLLTYQLYDKFAEAVAIQLEEERLVKIRDVLKELPRPHYRTLEFLMCHLVRVASYSAETNMHARNLAIVWAPNLLRSKDIEASGFNGTAVFKEVRVQSIVVEFILTHVPQLFPEQGASHGRRKSLPSPTAEYNQEEGLFKSGTTQPVPNFGNISPGDGPLPIRPYHAIIEGTDKRKGSLKGRKWMSIFNIGGRFHDPRRRHKHSKEKDRPVLRPARSMDSLSTPSYPNEGSRRTGQRPPSSNTPIISPLVTHSSQSGSDATIFSGAISGSEYAVTYRRGTGLLSGGPGIQGTYTALDPEGSGFTDNETLQSRSPGHSTKVGRRAAMHITGPTLVTVPLHIHSNLAFGVLQGGGGDRIIHCGRDKDGGDRVEGKEGGEKVKRESRVVERRVEDCRKVEKEEKNHMGKVMDREGVVVAGEDTWPGGHREDEEKEEVREKCRRDAEVVMGGMSREQQAKSLTSNPEDDSDKDAVSDAKDVDENDEYMDMKGMNPADFEPQVMQHEGVQVFDASGPLNSTEVEEDDLRLSGYIQDNFEFLDQMDCCVLDHMDCSVPYQVHEFSVEPPGHSDEEYDEYVQLSHHPAELQTHLQPSSAAENQTALRPHRPLSMDVNSRHTKSLSLPYMTSPVHGPQELCSEEEVAGDDSDDDDYSSEDDDSMFIKSLPTDFFLRNYSGFEPDLEAQESFAPESVSAHELQSPEEVNVKFPACKDQEQTDAQDREEKDSLEENVSTGTEEEDKIQEKREHLENIRQSKVSEQDHSAVVDSQSGREQLLSSEASTHCCSDLPLLSDDETSTMVVATDEEEKEEFNISHSDYAPCDAASLVTQKETADASFVEHTDFSVNPTEEPGTSAREDTKEGDSDDGQDRNAHTEIEDTYPEMVLEIQENDERKWGEIFEESTKVDIKLEEQMEEGSKEQDTAGYRTCREISTDVGFEVTEEEESKVAEMKFAGERVAVEINMIDYTKAGEREELIAEVSGEKMVEVDEGGANEAGKRMAVEESSETSKEKLTDTALQQEFEKKKTNVKTPEPDGSEASRRKLVITDETQYDGGEEVVSTENYNNDKVRADKSQSRIQSIELVRPDMKEMKEVRKCEDSDSWRGGVGMKLVTSKHSKIYTVKAVPVVPPKPQHCRITALTLRQKQQQRERKDADRGRETLARVSTEQDTACGGEQGKDADEGRGAKEKPTLRGGEKERETRRDGDESATRDTSRNSPLSMCFDEAVAIATMRRGKEKECEKERQREWGNE